MAAAVVLIPRELDSSRLRARLRGSIDLMDALRLRDLDRALLLLDCRAISILFAASFARFSRASTASRHRLLRRFMTSRIAQLRTIYFAVQRLVVSAHYSDPEVQRRLGYAGPRSAAT